MNAGPLAGLRLLELGGVGPSPMAAMLLADLGASVLRIERPTPSGLGVHRPDRYMLLNRSRPSVVIDLKQAEGVELVLSLAESAEAIFDPFRPGTTERLGLGPDPCLARNPALVYTRITGWGQQGPLAHSAGHDINYLALSGAAAALGRRGEPPALPLNLLGDFAGGALYAALGTVSAVLHARRTGQGQVVDAAIVDGAASLMTLFYGSLACGVQQVERGTNVLDGGAYYWDTYRCADGGFVSVAPIESKFRAILLERLGLADRTPPLDALAHGDARAVLAEVFARHDRDHWARLFEGTDACVAPVLTMAEAPSHPHHLARESFVAPDGIVQPRPAPRFSRTPSAMPTPPESAGASSRSALLDWGVASDRVDALCASGVVIQR
ncbi:MAG: CoA transferase [Gammaproteobacteria bacterium]|nr:CoA transferase [Gammaproteobacteria bacterium]MBU1440206.1 CoA transferase [Gammaproteobacteria bacterium]MBU2409978.1 CoA transferase [Gammaproteobacteria bacterium]